jgi:hypothetical protein
MIEYSYYCISNYVMLRNYLFNVLYIKLCYLEKLSVQCLRIKSWERNFSLRKSERKSDKAFCFGFFAFRQTSSLRENQFLHIAKKPGCSAFYNLRCTFRQSALLTNGCFGLVVN